MRAHKFLWALGLFLFWDTGLSVISYASQDQKLQQSVDWASKFRALPPTAVTVVALLIAFIFFQVFFRARAAIILGTKSILDKKPTDFGKTFSQTGKYYQRLAAIWFLTLVCLFVAALILATPVIYLANAKLQARAEILGLFALVIFIPLSVIANFVNNLAPMFAVIHDLKFRDSIAASMDLIGKFWVGLLVFMLWLGLLTFLASYFVVIIGGSGVVFLAHLFYNVAGIHHSVGSIILAVLAIIVFLIFTAAISAYQQVAWTILFNEIVRPEKLEEEESVPVPEIV